MKKVLKKQTVEGDLWKRVRENRKDKNQLRATN